MEKKMPGPLFCGRCYCCVNEQGGWFWFNGLEVERDGKRGEGEWEVKVAFLDSLFLLKREVSKVKKYSALKEPAISFMRLFDCHQVKHTNRLRFFVNFENDRI
jgi:hypothetical protein